MLRFQNRNAKKSLRVHLYSTLIGLLLFAVIGVTIAIGLKKVNPIYYSNVIDLDHLEYWGLSRFTIFLMVARTETLVILFAWILAAIALAHGVGGILMMKHFIKKRGGKEFVQKLEREMSLSAATWFPLSKVYLTDHYIISFSNGFFAVTYSDIFWMYKDEHFLNGIKTRTSLMIAARDGKKYETANIFSTKKNADEEYVVITETAQEKNPSILTGFTKENILEFNHLKKNKCKK